METRLVTLEDMRSPRVRATAARQRNATAAGAEPFYQARLRAYIKALVDAYGYREDYRGTSPPWRVPYLPLPFAGQMVSYFDVQAKHWLDSDKPDGAKQPNLIRKWRDRAFELVGEVAKDGSVSKPAASSYEDAPSAVAAKAPGMFSAAVAAGQPHAKVLKADETWKLLDALIRLAIHFDVLSGQPSRIDLFVEAVEEQVAEVGEAAMDIVKKASDVPRYLKWLAVGAAGLGGLYLVTR